MRSSTWKTILAFLPIALFPACGGGGGGGQSGPVQPDPSQSSFTADTSFGTLADGLSTVALEALLADRNGNALAGIPVEFRASGYGNQLVQPSVTDADGRAFGTLASTASEAKLVRAVARPGTADESEVGTLTTTFVEVLPDAYYVRQGGSDANTGASPLDAWQTIDFALTQVGAGDTLFVGAGTYPPFELTNVATAARPLRLRADREGRFTGDVGEVVVDAGGTQYGVLVNGAEYVSLEGFSIRGAQPAAAEASAGVLFAVALNEHVSIVDNSIYENERGVQVQAARGLVLENNRISRNDGDGIALGLTAGSAMIHNLVYANGGAGLALDGVSTDLVVALSTFYRNTGDQICERSSGSTGSLSDNVLSEGGADALALDPNTSLTPSHNMSWANTGQEVQLNPDPGAVVADPLFLDPAGEDGLLGGLGARDDDFRVEPGSPALDAGDRPANQLALTYGGPAATMVSRADDVRDGEAPDGATVNLGFHYPGPLDAFTSLEPGGTRLAYTLPGQATLRTALRAADQSWSASMRAQDLNSDVAWVVHRASQDGPEEFSATLADTGARTELRVRRWNGRRWSEDMQAPLVSNIDPANAGERGFDLELEDVSGDALLVYSNDDANPLFRTFSNGAWSQDAPVFPAALGTGSVLWVELVPRAGSDDVALVALDDDQNLTAAVWDGASWKHHALLATQVVALRKFQAFDAAWESLSGELLVAWGFSVFAEQAMISTLDPLSGTWTGGMHPSSEAIGAVVRLASDPTSDRIAAAFGEGDQDDDVSVSIWNGSGFENTAEVTLQGVFGQQSIDIAWIGDTGYAYALWRDQGQGGTLMSARFRDAWKIQPELAPAGVGACIQTEITDGPSGDASQVVLLDATGSLFGFDVTWNGDGLDWTLQNSGLPLATGMDMMRTTRTFSCDLRRP